MPTTAGQPAEASVPDAHFDQMLPAESFKESFRNHPAGVSVVTANPGNGPVGLTATSVFSVSANPPLLVFSLSAHSSSTPAVRAAETVVVHLLGAEQLSLAKTFLPAESTGSRTGVPGRASLRASPSCRQLMRGSAGRS